MRVFQRMMMLIMAAGYAMFLLDITMGYQTERKIKQWEKVYSDRFVEQICHAGGCSLLEYQSYIGALFQVAGAMEFCISEYQIQYDVSGQTYEYMVSWEEIKQQLFLEEHYAFQEGSRIELVAIDSSGTKRIRCFGECMGEYGTWEE